MTTSMKPLIYQAKMRLKNAKRPPVALPRLPGYDHNEDQDLYRWLDGWFWAEELWEVVEGENSPWEAHIMAIVMGLKDE